MKVLIVLDISGVMCIKGNNGIRISQYYCIEPIDGYMKFINRLLELGYDIAWFSSTSMKNATKILKELQLYHKPSVFKWYGAGTIKELTDVKKKYPQYNKYIIIDDSPEKIMCNIDNEKIIFEGNYNDTMEHIERLILNEDRIVGHCQE